MSGAGGSSGGSVLPGWARARDVVRDVVAVVAPAELPVVDGLAQFDDPAVVRRLRRRRGRREPLGFGVGEVLALVTPVVWLVVDQAAKKAADAAVLGTAKGIRSLLRKVFRRRSAQVVVPPLAPEQLAEVRQRVLATAGQWGMEAAVAEAVADAVVARLAMGAGTPGVAGPDVGGGLPR